MEVDVPYSFDQIRSPLKLHILEIIGSNSTTSEELADELGVDRPHASKYLLQYYRQGLLNREKGHREFIYELSDKGEERKNYLKKQVE